MLRKLLLILILLLVGQPAPAAQPVILVLGDSLSAAWGLDRGAGWVDLLRQRLERGGHDYRVVNASISGETTSGGLSRIHRELERHRPEIVIVELGGNDGLRGLPLAQTRRNLAAIIETVDARAARSLLVGMRLPPNYGSAYTEGFHRIYVDLAEEHGIPFVPFLLQGLDDDRHFQADRIHPTAEAQPIMLENVWPHLEPLLTAAP